MLKCNQQLKARGENGENDMISLFSPFAASRRGSGENGENAYRLFPVSPPAGRRRFPEGLK